MVGWGGSWVGWQLGGVVVGWGGSWGGSWVGW